MERCAWACAVCSIAVGLIAARAATGAVILENEPQGRFSVADDRDITRTLRFAGTGERTLVIRVISGSIRVTGSDDPTVDLRVRQRIRAADEAALRDAERELTLDIADNAATVGAVARGPEGEICGERNENRRGWRWRPRYDVTFEVVVRVPRGTRLALCTINGGEIRVDQTAGDFDVSNVNGRITMNDIRGSGPVETVNGAIAVTFTESPGSATRFKTVNGDVTVAFPAGLSADLALKTLNGDLLTDFDVQPLPQPAPSPVEERRGGVPGDQASRGMKRVYRSNDFTRVRVGRGGPEISFETLNGDVRVTRASR